MCLQLDENSTSTYSLGDHDQIEIDHDEAPFTTVTYRKKRSQCIPVVFKPTEAQSFWRMNPRRIVNDIVTAAQGKMSVHQITRADNLLVRVTSPSSANKLQEIAGFPVYSCVPQSHSRNFGKFLKYLPQNWATSASRKCSCRPRGMAVLSNIHGTSSSYSPERIAQCRLTPFCVSLTI